MSSTQDPFLFIAGVPKAGTTSLFTYLAGHPEIAPAAMKEPCYFVGDECPLRLPMRYGVTTLDEYLAQFGAAGNRVRLDGSTLYFTYLGAPERIRSTAPNSKAVVSLREPLSRLESCYKMARFQRWIAETMSFDDYVRAMLEWTPASGGDNALFEEGRYSGRLARWRAIFGNDLLIIWFNDLVRDARAETERVCAFAGIDPRWHATYAFKAEHVSRERVGNGMRRLQRRIESAVRARLRGGGWLRRGLSKVRRPVARRLDTVLTRPASRLRLDPRLHERVFRYYAADLDALTEIVGREPPWAAQYRSRSNAD